MKAKFLTISLLASTLIYGAGFNCKKASTPTEKTICANRGLSLLDDAMSMLYNTNNGFLEFYAENEVANKQLANMLTTRLKKSQQSFIKQRELCGNNINCILDSTNKRVNILFKISNAERYDKIIAKADKRYNNEPSYSVGASGFDGAGSLVDKSKIEFAYMALYNRLAPNEKVKLSNEQKAYNKSVEKAWDRLYSESVCGTDRSACYYEEGKMAEKRLKTLQQRLKALK